MKLNYPKTQLSLALAAIFSLAACSHQTTSEQASTTTAVSSIANPDVWPEVKSKIKINQDDEAKISQIINKMTIEQKVAQMIQPEIRAFDVEDMRKYGFGSYLNGGGAFPNNDKYASMQDWADLAEEMYQASVDDSLDGNNIPTMWGTDAVHGHNNVIGATVYPHNIGLGAMHNPELIEKIGAATAKIVQVTGIDWVFAPTVAVVRDDRWGRTYEGYSEDPELVKQYASAMVKGMQGEAGKNFMGDGTVIATAKHFLGDGGTDLGIDQGNNLASEADLVRLHAQGYVSAIEEGVQTIMASFNSWHGEKMHGNHSMLTTVLKQKMGFDGLVVGDWDGHGQVTGCSNASCAQAINAGVDIIMVPNEWKAMYENTVSQVKSGEISIARIDDAVRRILRVKMRAGLFNGESPINRAFAGEQSLLGATQHRQLARQAVRESLVLLKNNQQVLPINPSQHILVAGSGADDIGKQSGGWTISWQGTGNKNSDFPGASSIYDGIKQAVDNAGGKTELNQNGDFTQKPDVAIVVFGENPYAEGVGDIEGIEYQRGNKRDIKLLNKLKAQGIPVVSVFLSGRPLWVNAELNASDAFVAAWLPGSEGIGIADVLLSKTNGEVNYDFSGKLAYSWPKSDAQVVLNVGDQNYDPLFPYGYGLTYQDNINLPDTLNEIAQVKFEVDLDEAVVLFDSQPQQDLGLYLGDKASWAVPVATSIVTTQGSDNLHLKTTDKNVQEDARLLTWAGVSLASAYLAWSEPHDMSVYLNNHTALTVNMRVEQMPQGSFKLNMQSGKQQAGVELNELLNTLPKQQWHNISVALNCFEQTGINFSELDSPFALATDGKAKISFAEVSWKPKSADNADINCQ
ncbi:exo 1,3/1,4-beta-D-glucan glucohydrolase [Catenovulum sp. 2E275]|uniref:glycoside hydrolase family 3 protein n=1 Tax=Catenovulum sp. 2E275 TaxID=2980497 RepID=UPI0021CF1EC1|nr:glycoside hydrolase family 3 protein [Catenovulum sp. 2E275]MCU4674100.1 exo 1,3/1,4-beta-D-glucan glucohydrolase [Catenovulum sp. 2E275]